MANRLRDRTLLNLVKRTTPIVQDLDRSLAFHRDALGVTAWYDDDLAAVNARLIAVGARIHAEPHEFRVREVDGTEIRMTTLSCRDPDGYFLEINQRDAS